MNLDLANIVPKLQALLSKSRRYSGFVITLAVLGAFGFVVFQINRYSRLEPDESELETRLLEVRSPKIDEEAIARIKSLEERNVEVKALFDNARQNPFQE